MSDEPDHVFVFRREVFRKAFGLSETHGRFAASYAAKLAKEAFDEGADDEHALWKAVEASFKPRSDAT